MRSPRLCLVACLALTSACGFTLVRPVIEKRAADGTVAPTCFSNSYVWPALDVAAAAFFLVAPALELERERDRCAAGDESYCSSTDSLVLLYTVVGAPVFAGSAYSGFRAARRCRQAGSAPRWSARNTGHRSAPADSPLASAQRR